MKFHINSFCFCIHSVIIPYLPSLLQSKTLQHHTQANMFTRWKYAEGKRRKSYPCVQHFPSVNGTMKRLINGHCALLSEIIPSLCFSLEFSLLSFLFWKKKWTDDLPFSVQFSHLVMSNSLQLYGLKCSRLPCPSPTPGACSNSCPSVSNAIQPPHPLLSPPPPAFNISQYQGLFQWVTSFHQVAKVLELQLQHQSFQWILWTVFL